MDQNNSSPLAVAVVAAITKNPQEPGVRIELPHAPGQPRRVSYVLPYQVRTVSHERLTRRLCAAAPDVCREVARRLALFTRVSDGR